MAETGVQALDLTGEKTMAETEVHALDLTGEKITAETEVHALDLTGETTMAETEVHALDLTGKKVMDWHTNHVFHWAWEGASGAEEMKTILWGGVGQLRKLLEHRVVRLGLDEDINGTESCCELRLL
ncbi:hypothetical protein CYMTET_40881 [Cymbomonas tetramitiformis]|uniref:Uncharacterized protein n=1 Tax=Cymbomonas tetramitiformis TaxID=36881 RepID=A0AAE0C896_9CHLO|nr:hypothetical protein CYMTET_40881 [Cymbomonas tetramitiformis]